MFIRGLVYLGLLYGAYRSIKAITEKVVYTKNNSGHVAKNSDDIMVKDPWCNVYFPKREGVCIRHEGQDLYFCSEECKTKFIDNS